MKKYLRNETIIKKGTYVNQIFKIKSGHVQSKREKKLFSPHDYILLDQIFTNSFAKDDYIALDQVIGTWINKDQIDETYFSIYATILQEKNNHITLLFIQDPITRIARYLFYEYQNRQEVSFYLTFSITDLAIYLNLDRLILSQGLHFLTTKEIISRHNKLFNILNPIRLEALAYRKE